MAISFVGQSQAAASTVTLPAGITAGDYIIICAYRNTTTAPTLPAGYTNIKNGSANTNAYRVGYKIATGSDSSGTWTNANVLQCVVYRGVAAIGNSNAVTNAASTTTNVPTVTLSETFGHSWIVAFAGSRQTTSQGAISGTTQRGTTQAGTTSMLMAADTNAGVTTWAATSSTAGTSATGSGIAIELVATNSVPTVALNTADATSTSNTTPTLLFTGSDADNDDLEYQFQLDTVSTFDSNPGSTPAIVQTAVSPAGSTFVTSMSTNAFASTITVGNYIIVGIGTSANVTNDIATVTDTKGNTYTRLTGVVYASGGQSVELWGAPITTGGTSNAVTATDSLSNLLAVMAVEVSGINTTSPVDQVGTLQTDTNATLTVPLAAATSNPKDALVLFATVSTTGTTWTAGSGYTVQASVDNAIGMAVETKIVTASGVTSGVITNSAANLLDVAAMVALQNAASPLISKTSTTDTGFADVPTPGDTHPFTQANQASYTVQSALTAGTYYWRVRAKDVTGNFGSWATARTIIISSGTAYTKSLTASVSPTGTFAKSTLRALTAGLTSAGNFSKRVVRSLTASVTPTGAFTKQLLRSFTAGLTSAGTLATARLKAMAFTASLSPAGTIGRAINRPFTASITPAGAFTKRTVRNITASLSPTGAFTKKFIHSFTASLSPTGAFTKLVKKALTAGMTSSGSLKKGIRRGLTASLTPAGAFSRSLIKFVTFTANMTFVGSVGTLRRMIFTAGLTMSGTIANRWIPVVGSVVQTIAATITSGIRTALGGTNTNSTSVNSGNVVATDNGADTIREISTNTNNQTLDNPSNKTEVD